MTLEDYMEDFATEASRKEFAELTSGEVLLRGVESANPWVIAGARRLKGRTVAVLVSLSNEEETATLSIEGKTGSFQMMLHQPRDISFIFHYVNKRFH